MTELGWSTTKTRCSRGASAGKKAAGVTEAQQAAYLKLAYHCLSYYPYVKAALWFSLRDTSSTDSELHALRPHALRRLPQARRTTRSRRSRSPGPLPAPAAATSPRPTSTSSSPGRRALRPLPEHPGRRPRPQQQARAHHALRERREDPQLHRRGAGEQPPRRHPVDGRAQAPVRPRERQGRGPRRVRQHLHEGGRRPARRPAAMPAQRPVVGLRVSGKGMKRTVRGLVSARGAAFLPAGKVVIEWQFQRKGRWVTLHKRSKNANRPFSYAQRLRKPGAWRRRRALHRRQAVPLRAVRSASAQRPLIAGRGRPPSPGAGSLRRYAPHRRPLRGHLHRPAERRAARGAAAAHDQVGRLGDGPRRHRRASSRRTG